MKSALAILALALVIVPASAASAYAPAVASASGDSLQAACKLGMYYRGPAQDEFASTYTLACGLLAPAPASGSAMPALDLACQMSPKFAMPEMGEAVALVCTMITPQNDASATVLPLDAIAAPCPSGVKFEGPASETIAQVACLDVDPSSVSTYMVTKELPLYWCSALECTPQGRAYLVLRDLGVVEE